MKATEGNGGAPIVTSREPVERPTIPRGLLQVPADSIVTRHGIGTATLALTAGEFTVTYHEVNIVSDDGAHVGADAHGGVVVTWERREAP